VTQGGQQIDEALRLATEGLRDIAVQPPAEAEWLLAELLGCVRAALPHHRQPTQSQAHRYHAWLRQRASGLPFSYVCGRQPFRGMNLRVSPAVLIPRPETEQLVDWALPHIPAGSAVLDLCTGSGCIALALRRESPAGAVYASDVSVAALAVARGNAAEQGVTLELAAADGLKLPAAWSRFAVIVSNPPYIASGDAHLAALQHEPELALVSGADGLDLIRSIIREAGQHLCAGGVLLLEHGYDQAAAVRALLAAAGFIEVLSHRDYSGIERASQGRWP